MSRQFFAEQGVSIGDDISTCSAVTAANLECRDTGAPAEKANHSGSQHDQREWHIEEEDQHEGCCRETAHHHVLE